MTQPLSRRFFNTTGPCRLDDHYMLMPGRRLPEIHRLIAARGQRAYPRNNTIIVYTSDRQ